MFTVCAIWLSDSGQRFFASQMRLWHSPCQRTPLGCHVVSHVKCMLAHTTRV